MSKSNNLLTPDAALDVKQNSADGERRKSVLSSNGFFIDYSSIRRRSSAAVQTLKSQQQQKILSQYVSPTRWPRGASICVGATNYSQPSSPSRQSKSHLAATALLLPTPTLLNAPIAIAGSRKTSIFDPKGHSLVSHVPSPRRKSTMVTASPLVPANDGGLLVSQSSLTMLSVARRAARGETFARRKSKLAEHVPVIGCSPTSIQASLNVLDETRRYEKLLRRLERQKRSKEKRKAKQQRRARQQLLATASSDQSDGENGVQLGKSDRLDLRRKSIRAIRDAAALLAGRGRPSRQLTESSVQARWDELSISSMSLVGTISSSLSSLDGYELDNDELFYDENTMINPNDIHQMSSRSASSLNILASGNEGLGRKFSKRGTRKKSLLKSAMNKLINRLGSPNPVKQSNDVMSQDLEDSPPGLESTSPGIPLHVLHQRSSTSNEDGSGNDGTNGSNNPLQSQTGSPIGFRAKSRRRRRSRRSMTISGGLNYLHYYYYLRENSLDAIDDLPVLSANVSGTSKAAAAGQIHGGSGGGGTMSGGIGSGGETAVNDLDRRARLHINYSLARISILNSRSDPRAKLADRLASLVSPSNLNHPSLSAEQTVDTEPQSSSGNVAQQSQHISPMSRVFDYSQSSDSSSLILSTTSSSSGKSADCEDESNPTHEGELELTSQSVAEDFNGSKKQFVDPQLSNWNEGGSISFHSESFESADSYDQCRAASELSIQQLNNQSAYPQHPIHFDHNLRAQSTSIASTNPQASNKSLSSVGSIPANQFVNSTLAQSTSARINGSEQVPRIYRETRARILESLPSKESVELPKHLLDAHQFVCPSESSQSVRDLISLADFCQASIGAKPQGSPHEVSEHHSPSRSRVALNPKVSKLTRHNIGRSQYHPQPTNTWSHCDDGEPNLLSSSRRRTNITGDGHHWDDNEEELDDFEKLERRHSSYRYKVAQLEVEQMRRRERQKKRDLRTRQESKGASKSDTTGRKKNQGNKQNQLTLHRGQRFSSDPNFHSCSDTTTTDMNTTGAELSGTENSSKTNRRKRRRKFHKIAKGCSSRASVKSVKSNTSNSNSCGLDRFGGIGSFFGRIARVSLSWDTLTGDSKGDARGSESGATDGKSRVRGSIGRHSLKHPIRSPDQTHMKAYDSRLQTTDSTRNLGNISLVVPKQRSRRHERHYESAIPNEPNGSKNLQLATKFNTDHYAVCDGSRSEVAQARVAMGSGEAKSSELIELMMLKQSTREGLGK